MKDFGVGTVLVLPPPSTARALLCQRRIACTSEKLHLVEDLEGSAPGVELKVKRDMSAAIYREQQAGPSLFTWMGSHMQPLTSECKTRSPVLRRNVNVLLDFDKISSLVL